jgi:hypothetical protein
MEKGEGRAWECGAGRNVGRMSLETGVRSGLWADRKENLTCEIFALLVKLDNMREIGVNTRPCV